MNKLEPQTKRLAFASRFLIAKKGGNSMECNHGRIKSVNCRIFCDICGAELPVDYLMGKPKTEPAKTAETPENGGKTATKRTSRKKV